MVSQDKWKHLTMSQESVPNNAIGISQSLESLPEVMLYLLDPDEHPSYSLSKH